MTSKVFPIEAIILKNFNLKKNCFLNCDLCIFKTCTIYIVNINQNETIPPQNCKTFQLFQVMYVSPLKSTSLLFSWCSIHIHDACLHSGCEFLILYILLCRQYIATYNTLSSPSSPVDGLNQVHKIASNYSKTLILSF